MTREELKRYLDMLYTKAEAKMKEGEIPVSALLLLDDGSMYLEGNSVEKDDNPFEHAEIKAIRRALSDKKTRYLKNSTLIVTLEPCLMCMGAIVKAGIKRILYVLDDEKLGSLSHYHCFVDDVVEIQRIEDIRFAELMKNFFSNLRNG